MADINPAIIKWLIAILVIKAPTIIVNQNDRHSGHENGRLFNFK